MKRRTTRARVQAAVLLLVPFILLALWAASGNLQGAFGFAGSAEAALLELMPESTTEPPLATTEPPAATTEPPVATTEPPTVTPEPPTVTPEPFNEPPGDNCSYTQGYWKNHPEDWPVLTLTVGGQDYSQAEALDHFDRPTRGDATYILIHQLMAAMLNVANGADSAAIDSTLADAHQWLVDNPLGSRPINPERSVGIGLAQTLDDFNNGLIGPGHCD